MADRLRKTPFLQEQTVLQLTMPRSDAVTAENYRCSKLKTTDMNNCSVEYIFWCIYCNREDRGGLVSGAKVHTV